MQRAISLAGEVKSSDDVPVGALIVNEAGEVISSGKNEREKDNDPTAHAVRNAGGGNVNKGAQKMYGLMKQLEAGGMA